MIRESMRNRLACFETVKQFAAGIMAFFVPISLSLSRSLDVVGQYPAPLGNHGTSLF